VIGQLWRSPSKATDTVLAAIGEVHPAKAVAKGRARPGSNAEFWSGT